MSRQLLTVMSVLGKFIRQRLRQVDHNIDCTCQRTLYLYTVQEAGIDPHFGDLR